MDILAKYRTHPVPREMAFPPAEYAERLLPDRVPDAGVRLVHLPRRELMVV